MELHASKDARRRHALDDFHYSATGTLLLPGFDAARSLARRLSEGEVFHIERQAQERFEDEHRRHTWNALLDGYVDWQKTHARDARRRLARAARELKRIDPSFSLKVFREKWGPPRRA